MYHAKKNLIIGPRESRLLREWAHERTLQLLDERARLVPVVLSSPDFRVIVAEHRARLLLLSEADAAAPAAAGPDTVGAVLAALDDRVGDMDSKVGQFIQELIQVAMEFAPDSVKQKIEAIKNDPKVKELGDVAKNAKEIFEWSKQLIDHVKGMKGAWDKSKAEAGDSLRKRLMYLFSNSGKVFVDGFKHFMSLKDLYGSNDLFKQAINAVGFKLLKDLWAKYKDDVLNMIPFGGQLASAWKMVKGVMDIGGKIAGLFKKAKEATADPQDKLASVAGNLIKGKDENLGALSKILQMDDDLESVLDDTLEAKFIEWYTKKLREVPPTTKLADIDVNKMLTAFVKGEYGKKNAHVGLAGA